MVFPLFLMILIKSAETYSNCLERRGSTWVFASNNTDGGGDDDKAEDDESDEDDADDDP